MIKRLRNYWQNHTNRRRFLWGSLGSGFVGAGSYTYMRLWESGWLEVNRHRAPIMKAERPLRLLHLSDLHASKAVSLGYLRRALEVGLELNPDLICLTGDFITWKYQQYDEYSEVLRALPEAAPAFACLGNHDGGSWAASTMKIGAAHSLPVQRMLKKAGIRLLHNEHTLLDLAGHTINLVGVGDLWNRECHSQQAFAELDDQYPTILLSHNPDTKTELAAHPWQLMLSGHTHGGQIYLPGVGDPLAPVKDKKYVRGLHRLGDRWLHITKGVGNLHGLRFNCRPEVSLLEIS